MYAFNEPHLLVTFRAIDMENLPAIVSGNNIDEFHNHI